MRVSINLAKRIAQELLVSFKELQGFSDASISQVIPIYNPLDIDTILFYEVKFISGSGADNGYAIISATEEDYPVVEFSETGRTHFDIFREEIHSRDFKMVRFGPAFMTAESLDGDLLAEIGERPSIIPEELKIQCRGEDTNLTRQRRRRKNIKPDIDIKEIVNRNIEPISYESLKQGFSPRKPPREVLRRHWSIAKSPQSPCEYDRYQADGFSNHPHYKQIPMNTPPNNNDHASGCGPTAWINLFGWHCLNWDNLLLNGTHHINDDYIDKLTMSLHDYLGTYEPWFTFGADQGFTWPEDMPKGIRFANEYLRHDCTYRWRYDYWNTDEDYVFEVARDIARKRRPFIVGYFEDWHYAIGYEIAECSKHGWKDHSWIKIYPAWSSTDIQNKWIPKSTIFGIYAVYDYLPLKIKRIGDSGNLAGVISEVKITHHKNDMLITATRDSNKNLKLILWKISANGTCQRISDSGSQAGKASNIDISVGNYIVTACRTSSGNLKLISWQVSQNYEFERKGDSGSLVGKASKIGLVALSSDLFITTCRTNENKLKLITWKILNNGSITRLNDSGNSAGFVSEISVLKIENGNQNAKVVTPVRTENGELKLILWEISSNGEIIRICDSGDQVGKCSMSDIRINQYGHLITSVRTKSNKLKLISWEISLDGNSSTIRRLADTGNMAGTIKENSLISLSNQLISAVKSGESRLKLISWVMTESGAFSRFGDSGLQAGVVNKISQCKLVLGGKERIVTAVQTADKKLKLIVWQA